MTLSQYISKPIRVTVSDGRAFFGQLMCTDRDCDVIIQDAVERRTDLTRYVGMIVVPGRLIKSISVQKE